MQIDILFSSAECRRNHSFFKGEKRDFSHPICRSWCGLAHADWSWKKNKKKWRQRDYYLLLLKALLKALTQHIFTFPFRPSMHIHVCVCVCVCHIDTFLLLVHFHFQPHFVSCCRRSQPYQSAVLFTLWFPMCFFFKLVRRNLTWIIIVPFSSLVGIKYVKTLGATTDSIIIILCKSKV